MDMFESTEKLFGLLEALDTAEQLSKELIQEKIVGLSHIIQPDGVCWCCLSYLQMYPDVADHHQLSILQAMEKVLRSQIEAISFSTAKETISVALTKMGRHAKVPPDIQQAASDILVSVGSRFPGEVTEHMEFVFRGDVGADPVWLNMLASLTRAIVSGMVHRLRAILDYVKSTLMLANEFEAHMAFCSVLSKFIRSIEEFSACSGESPDLTVRREDFAAIVESALRTIFKFWPEPELREPVLNALAAMTPLLPPKALQANVPRLISAALTLYKDGTHTDALGQNMYQILEATLELGHTLLNPFVHDLLAVLHQEISTRPESRLAGHEHSKVLCSVTLLANAFPWKVGDFVISKLKSSSEPSRAASLLMLTHLLSTAGAADFFMLWDPSEREFQDSQRSFSQRSCSIFCLILGHRAFELREQVPEIMDALLPCLPLLSDGQLRLPVSLATQHPVQVAKMLLSWALPLDSSWCNLWRAFGGEEKLSRRLQVFLMGKLSVLLARDPAEDWVSAAFMTLAVTCALRELLTVPGAAGAFQKVFPQLFAAVLLQMGRSEEIPLSAQEADTPSQSVCRVTVLVMQALLPQAQLGTVIDQMDRDLAWVKLQSPETHNEGVGLLGRAMAQHCGPLLPGIVEVLVPYLSADREQHRVAATAFFSEVGTWLCWSVGLTVPRCPVFKLKGCLKRNLRDVLLKSLKHRVQDPSVPVRVLLFQGLGRATAAQVEEHCQELLAILSSGLKDNDLAGRQTVLGALSALLQVLRHLRQDSIGQDVIAEIWQSVTWLLKSDDAELRSAGADILGDLCQCQAVTAHIEQELQGALVRLVLYLRDPSPEVAQACLRSLVNSGSVLKLNTILISRIEDQGDFDYHDFLDDFATFLVSDFPKTLDRSFSCAMDCLSRTLPEVRASAAIFIGFLFKNTPETLLPRTRQIDEILLGLKRVMQEEPSDKEVWNCTLLAHGYGTVSQHCRQQRQMKMPLWKRLFCCSP